MLVQGLNYLVIQNLTLQPNQFVLPQPALNLQVIHLQRITWRNTVQREQMCFASHERRSYINSNPDFFLHYHRSLHPRNIIIILSIISHHDVSFSPAGSAGSHLPPVLHDGSEWKWAEKMLLPVSDKADSCEIHHDDTRQFCANPSDDWVKNIMNQIDGRLFQ
ncbi:hypothetical protein HF521_020064 [Silurus meridionalis]|uniref:Uncharacterized protein n=1 Tax=Silurus meridionalis TaxID=175797 RepID=A0A8T0BN68_SILME|nr:hypothetical protein HF521_020064 [Silurus meridionalis]